MATIKEGTYELAKTLNLPSSSLNIIVDRTNYFYVGSISVGEAGQGIVISTSSIVVYDDSFTPITVYENGAWVSDEYRTWINYTTDPYVTATDGTQEWLDANLYVPEAKFVRLIREDEVENPTQIPHGILTACNDFIGAKYVTGVYATIDGIEKTIYETNEYENINYFTFALYSTPSQIRVSYSFNPTSSSVKVYALASYGVADMQGVTYSGNNVIVDLTIEYFFGLEGQSLFFNSLELD